MRSLKLARSATISALIDRIRDALADAGMGDVHVGTTPVDDRAEQVLVQGSAGILTVEDWGMPMPEGFPCTVSDDWTVRVFVATFRAGWSDLEAICRCEELLEAVINAAMAFPLATDPLGSRVTARPAAAFGPEAALHPDGVGWLGEARVDVECHADIAS
jgi:hypothetical protein